MVVVRRASSTSSSPQPRRQAGRHPIQEVPATPRCPASRPGRLSSSLGAAGRSSSGCTLSGRPSLARPSAVRLSVYRRSQIRLPTSFFLSKDPDFLVSAAVAEFKGPIIFGVVRIAQVNMELARIEASFSGSSPGKHGWAINEFGDLTSGAASTGKVYNPADQSSGTPLGDLGTLEAQETGEANFSGAKQMLRVVDLIGRSIVVYESEDRSDGGIAAAVIARSAGVGENYKKLCTCEGVTIWESS